MCCESCSQVVKLRLTNNVVAAARRSSGDSPILRPSRSSSPATDLGEAAGQRTLKRQAGVAAQRPLTRSAVKPRPALPF